MVQVVVQVVQLWCRCAGGAGGGCDGSLQAHEREVIVERLPCAGCPEITWVAIRGGSFMMGRRFRQYNWDDELPQRRVQVPDFQIMQNEVTVAQYRSCVEAGACSPPNCDRETVTNRRDGWLSCNYAHEREAHPVNHVSWMQLREFGAWVEADLPTEAQWEFAGRSRGQDILYPWGGGYGVRGDCRYADATLLGGPFNNPRSCHGKGTSPVCTHPIGHSEQGVCDLAGNVWEWVLDEYVDTYEGAPVDGSARCSLADCAGDALRVHRGGSWDTFLDELNNRRRLGNRRNPSNLVGGRLVRQAR